MICKNCRPEVFPTSFSENITLRFRIFPTVQEQCWKSGQNLGLPADSPHCWPKYRTWLAHLLSGLFIQSIFTTGKNCTLSKKSIITDSRGLLRYQSTASSEVLQYSWTLHSLSGLHVSSGFCDWCRVWGCSGGAFSKRKWDNSTAWFQKKARCEVV